jgi:hypothetical protein
MSEENKALVRRLVEGWQGGHRREVAEELLADDFADHSARPGEIATKEQGIQWFDLSCSGLVTTPAEVVEEGSGLGGDAGLSGQLLGADGDSG